MEKNFGDPIHPGEILADELEEIGMTAAGLAERLGVPKNRIYQIVNEERSITADTATRLGIFFGTTSEFWLNLQKLYELDLIDRDAKEFKDIKPYDAQSASVPQPDLSPSV